MIFLTLPELLRVAERAVEGDVVIRDAGLLDSALARPRSPAYTTLETKAAALLHSLARSRGLVDGNESLALAGLLCFLGVNGRSLTLTDEEGHDLTQAVASGELDDVGAIAARLR